MIGGIVGVDGDGFLIGLGGLGQVGIFGSGSGFGTAYVGIRQIAPDYMLIGVDFAGFGEAVDGLIPLIGGGGSLAER